MLGWDVREGLIAYRERIAKPAALDEHRHATMVWAVMARTKQYDGDAPKPPSILTD